MMPLYRKLSEHHVAKGYRGCPPPPIGMDSENWWDLHCPHTKGEWTFADKKEPVNLGEWQCIQLENQLSSIQARNCTQELGEHLLDHPEEGYAQPGGIDLMLGQATPPSPPADKKRAATVKVPGAPSKMKMAFHSCGSETEGDLRRFLVTTMAQDDPVAHHVQNKDYTVVRKLQFEEKVTDLLERAMSLMDAAMRLKAITRDV